MVDRVVFSRNSCFSHAAVLLAVSLFVLSLPTFASADAPSPTVAVENGIKIETNVCYTSDRDLNRSMDIYLPEKAPSHPLPLVVLIHGGGWNGGDKKDFGGAAREFVRRGFSCVSLNYRLSKQAIWPAQAVDCKAAIRWLRVNAAHYGFDPARIAVGGHSAGGHLSAFLAASNGVKKFDQGENLKASSDVQAEIWLAGVANLITRTTAAGYESEQSPRSGESRLVGGPVLQTQATALDASPITWVSKRTPPFYFCAGSADRQVPPEQIDEMKAVLNKFGIPSETHIVPGASHGGDGKFFDMEHMNLIVAFLKRTLKLGAKNGFGPAVGPGVYSAASLSAPQFAFTEGPLDNAMIDTAAGVDTQKWTFTSKGDGYYTISSVASPDLALTVQDGAAANQTPVIFDKNTSADDQLWTILRCAVGDIYYFVPKCAPSSVLENAGGVQAAGNAVDIWSYRPDVDRLAWTIVPIAK